MDQEALLNSTLVGLLIFTCTLGASLIAMIARRQVPSQHIEGGSGDVVKLVLGLVATLTALVLSLLVSSGYSAYQSEKTELRQLGVRVYQIDRALAHFGPDANAVRGELRQLLINNIERIWPTEGHAVTHAEASLQQAAETLFSDIERLSPQSDRQRRAQNRALDLLESSGETWHLLAAQSQDELSRPIFWILLMWLTVLFFGFGLFAQRNLTVGVALFVGSLSVSAAVFLIVEMSQPYIGWMRISAAPLSAALAQLGH